MSGILTEMAPFVSGTLCRGNGLLYSSYRRNSLILSAEEVVFNPANSKADWFYIPLGGTRPIPATAATAVCAAIHGMGNGGSTMEYQLFVRGYNDPHARGTWAAAGSAQSTGNAAFPFNTDELTLSGVITVSSWQWIELALGVHKKQDTDPASRCIFHVVPAVIY